MSAPSSPRYWQFYWPLALTGLVSLLAQQLQNGALARYPDAARELATFALAAGTFHLFDAALIFVPQMVNVLARSRAAAGVCLRFTLIVCALMTAPVVVLAIPAIGGPALGLLFHISGGTLDAVLRYMALLSPNILMAGLRNHYTGLIIQEKRTGTVTVLNIAFLAVVLMMLVIGFHAGWRAVTTLALAQLAASALHLALLWAVARRHCNPDRFGSQERLTYTAVWAFFWPVALTSVMFSLTRPILYSFLGRLPNAVPVIAAMRVGFDFAMIFHNLLNQFRHLFVTFGQEDLPGVRRFMTRVTVVVVGGMVIVVMTPLSYLLLHHVIGVSGEVLAMSRQVLMVLCLLPAVVTLRNYFHGIAMVKRETGPMGAGAVARNIASYVAAAILLPLGWLNHVSAAALLLLGFVAETLMVIYGPHLARTARAALAALPWAVAGEGED